MAIMDVDVALVQWPQDEARRRELGGRSAPRLLLVDERADPPLCTDALEDWIRLPAAPADVKARVKVLEARSMELTPRLPLLEDEGTLRYRSAEIVLPPLQASLVRPLVARFGALVTREALIESAWPGVDARRNTLDVHLVRVRRRLSSLGLHIRTVRSRGYMLTDLSSGT
jgi:DNA-binding response OmpR family regulator